MDILLHKYLDKKIKDFNLIDGDNVIFVGGQYYQINDIKSIYRSNLLHIEILVEWEVVDFGITTSKYIYLEVKDQEKIDFWFSQIQSLNSLI